MEANRVTPRSNSVSQSPNLTETLEQEADEALDEATARANEADVDYGRVLLEGVPYESIAEYNTEHDVDLIGMGTSGRSGLKEHLLGSTTDRVIRSVDTSVLLARR